MAVISVTFRTTGLSQLNQGIRAAGGQLAAFAAQANAAGVQIMRAGQTIGAMGTRLSLGLTLPLALAGGALVRFATNAVESENLFEVAMGDMATSARRFSERLRRDLGLNAFEVRKTIGTFFQMTTAMGVSADAALDVSQALTLLTNDLASFFNLRTDEAFLKIQSAISGEIEPLRRLGIVVNDVTIKNIALTEGIIKQGQELSEAQKVLLRTVAILRQTGNAQTDLARTIESPANQLRIMRARAENLAIELGSALLPALIALLGVLNAIVVPIQSVVTWFNSLTTAQKGMTVGAIGLVAALGPMLRIVGLLVSAFGAFLAVLTPVGLLVAGIVVIIGTFTAAFLALKAAAGDIERLWLAMWNRMKMATLNAAAAIVDALDGAVAKFLGLDDNLEAIRQRIRGMIDDTTIGAVQAGAASVDQAWTDLTEGMMDRVVAVKDGIMDAFASTFEFLGTQAEVSTEEFQKIYDEAEARALEAAKRIAGSLDTAAGQKAVNDLRDRYEALRGSLDPTVAAQQRMTEALTLLDDALAAGVIPSMEEYVALQAQVIDNYDAEIEKLNERVDASVQAEQRIRDQLTDTNFHALDVAQSIHGGMTRAFTDILTGAQSFGDGMKSIFRNVVNSILAELARIATSKIFATILNFAFPGLGSVFGGIFGGLFQTGGRKIVTRPQIIGVGETGPEVVSVRPLGGGNVGAEGVTIVFEGMNVINEIALSRFERRIATAIARGERRRIA